MFGRNFAALCTGTILVIAIGAAFTRAPADTEDKTFLAVAKADLADSQPELKCPQIAWPYGCEWRRPSSQAPTKHFSVQRHGRHYRVGSANLPPLVPTK